METVFETTGLTTRFNDVTALDGVCLRISRPSIVGLLGKNGRGKTTLIHHLMGLQIPTAGSVVTLGRPSSELGHEFFFGVACIAPFFATKGPVEAGRWRSPRRRRSTPWSRSCSRSSLCSRGRQTPRTSDFRLSAKSPMGSIV